MTAIESLTTTWMRCYTASLGTIEKYRSRLADLQTWDNSGGNKEERMAKVYALQNLIKSENYKKKLTRKEPK